MVEHLTIPGALEWDAVERHSIAALRYAGGKEHDVKYVSEVAYDALKAELKASREAAKNAEPAACLVRSRQILTPARDAAHGKDHFSEWSEWGPSSLAYGLAVTDPGRNTPVCYEIHMLYAALKT